MDYKNVLKDMVVKFGFTHRNFYQRYSDVYVCPFDNSLIQPLLNHLKEYGYTGVSAEVFKSQKESDFQGYLAINTGGDLSFLNN